MDNSYWTDSVSLKEFSKLEKDLNTDVVVVGGGITGLSTAYYLTKNGFNVCVLEKNRIASHATRKYHC